MEYVKDPNRNKTDFTQLTGNQIGVLLGSFLLSHTAGEKRFVLMTCVSSPMLGAIARTHGVDCEETLTGFKWIMKRAAEREKNGDVFVFGYEEALGYAVHPEVRDKDGISAALLFVQKTAELRSAGRTVFDELERLYRQYGLYSSYQVSVPIERSQETDWLARLRDAAPTSLAGVRVESVGDFARQHWIDCSTGVQTPIAYPSTPMLVFKLAGGRRAMVRPSGTEPKIKIYGDWCEVISPSESIEEASQRAEMKLRSMCEEIKKLVCGES